MYEKQNEQDLVTLRDKIFVFRDRLENQNKMNSQEYKMASRVAKKWKGKADLEEISKIFTTYLTTPTVGSTEAI